MKFLRKFAINKLGFRQQLAAIFSIGIVLLALVSSIVVSYLLSQSAEERVTLEGMNLAETLSDRSRVALLYHSDVDAKYVGDAMLAFPDVLAVGIYDDQQKPLYTTGSNAGEPNSDLRWPEQLQLVSESSVAWHFAAPVHTGSQKEENSPFLTEELEPELVGYVRLFMGKDSLRKNQREIFKYNLAVSFSLALVLLAILLAITSRVTKPISSLATTMQQARFGAKSAKVVRSDIQGTREVIEIQNAFNDMMDVLHAREEDLRATRDLALEAARVKGEFAANVSHELRTPLNGVLGMLELLNDMGLNEKQSEYIEIASGSAESLLSLIDNILDFSKIDSGKLSLEHIEFDLPDLLEEIVLLLSTQAQQKDIDLAYIIDPEIPEKILGDSGRLRQVLINLVGNALKFTERGEVGIEVKLKQIDGYQVSLHFEVFDTGIGMSQEAQDRIFEAFSQADGSITRKYGGTGLGLAISRQLVNLMGGKIGVNSQLGKGSSFWFELVVSGSDQKVVPSLPALQSDNLQVLLVDDSQLNRRYLGQILDTVSVNYDTASDGSLALEKLRLAVASGNPYQLVLLDEVMPGMKGSDLVRLIVNDPSLVSLKVIMMVNRANPTYEVTKSLNVAGFLSKPVKKRELSGMMVNLLGSGGEQLVISHEQEGKTDNRVASFGGRRVLVVEDNRANQQVALGMLERLGCKIDLANNGKEALKLIVRKHFDLVLMDCHMPEMDGYEATAQIRRLETEGSNVNIVAMTANVQQGESDKCLAVGMNDYLAKPLKIDVLKSMLMKWMPVTEYRVAGEHEETAAVPGSEGILDQGVFKALGEQVGVALGTLINVFIDDMPSYIRSLKDATSVKDASAVADIAHSIKGGAANFGANRLVDVCQQIEDCGRAGDLQDIEGLVAQAISECGLLQQALEYQAEQLKSSLPERHKDSEDEAGINDNQPLQNQRILVVDDDRGMRFAMRKVLEDDGYRVDEVQNGEQALMYCERFMPDLVLMDAIMPEMDGFKACSEIQALPGGKHLPVLIITALNDETSIGRAFAAGATDYISKPVNFAVLRKRISRVLQASQAEQRIHRLAYNDTLTGLPNRTLFTEKLSQVLAESDPESMVAVLFLDLDRFKLINDTFGHDAGDLLVKVVAERLQGCVRQGDVVSRFGGDEFTIILDRVKSYNVVKNIVTKIHETLSRPFVFLGKEMHVSTSIGISMYPNDGVDIGTLLKNADIAMYRAKERGDCYEFYEQKMEADVARRLGIESDLRGAIERGEMMVYYQPQEDLATGELIGMEALVRWQHPSRGMMNPLEFIGLAEETGQILELGEWVMKTACAQLKSWLDKGCPPIRMAVNLASRQLENGSIVEQVAATLIETGLPSQNLELEITESTIMANAEEVIVTLERLKTMGVQLAVDDFGTGYSSLNYLKRFPIDMLKIDRAFVSDITVDKVDADIVTTIITLAHSLGVKVIAEGVETEEQKAYLKKEGCNYIQGYFLGKPMPAEDFEKQFLAGKMSSDNLVSFASFQKNKPA